MLCMPQFLSNLFHAFSELFIALLHYYISCAKTEKLLYVHTYIGRHIIHMYIGKQFYTITKNLLVACKLNDVVWALFTIYYSEGL